MIIRKLVINGSSTTVSIPKVMLSHINRYAGDYVSLSIQGDCLIIRADNSIPAPVLEDKYCKVCNNIGVKCKSCRNYDCYRNDSLGI